MKETFPWARDGGITFLLVITNLASLSTYTASKTLTLYSQDVTCEGNFSMEMVISQPFSLYSQSIVKPFSTFTTSGGATCSCRNVAWLRHDGQVELRLSHVSMHTLQNMWRQTHMRGSCSTQWHTAQTNSELGGGLNLQVSYVMDDAMAPSTSSVLKTKNTSGRNSFVIVIFLVKM